MEVRKGYKQTEIGIIPNDWEVTTFENIADKTKKWSITGGPFGSNLKTSDYTNDGVQIIQLQNIGDGSFINESQVYTSKEKANQLLSCNIYPGEIILSKMGDPVARCCFIPNTAERFLMASDGIKLVVNEKKFNKRFVHEYINSKYFRLRAFDISTGSTRLRIGLPNLKSLSFIKPPLQEQTAIANALSNTDNWINSLEQLLTKKRQIKQGAMQELLQAKEGWEVKKLGEILNYIQPTPYLVTDTEYSNDFSIPVLTAGKTFLLGYTSEEFGIFDDLPTIIFDDFTTAIQFVDFPFKAKSSAMKMLVLKDKSNNLKLMFEIIKNIKYPLGDHKRHWIGEYSKIEIKLPEPEEQARIASILGDMDEEIAQLETKLAKAKQIKQGMMQELLTGRIRLV